MSTLQSLPPLLVESSPWSGLQVGRYRYNPAESGGLAFRDVSIDVQLSSSYCLEWNEAGKWKRREMLPRDLCVMPAGIPTFYRWSAEIELLRLAIAPDKLEEVARDLKIRRIEIAEQHGGCDPLLENLAQALRREQQAGYPWGRAYGEALGVALCAQLLRRQRNSSPPAASPLRPALVRRVRDLIEARLADDIGLDDMARAAGLSAFHFIRTFQSATGTSPHLYLMEVRIERAVALLLRGVPIAQAAQQCGFCDQSHLNRHLKRHLGITPGQLLPRRARRASLTH